MNKDRSVFLVTRNISQFVLLLGTVSLSAWIIKISGMYSKALLTFEAFMLAIFVASQLEAAIKEKKMDLSPEGAVKEELVSRKRKCNRIFLSTVISLMMCDVFLLISRSRGYFPVTSEFAQQMSMVLLMGDIALFYLAWVMVKNVLFYKNQDLIASNKEVVTNSKIIDEFYSLADNMTAKTALRALYDRIPANCKEKYKEYMEKVTPAYTLEVVADELWIILQDNSEAKKTKQNFKEKLDLLKAIYYVPQFMSVMLIATYIYEFIGAYSPDIVTNTIKLIDTL